MLHDTLLHPAARRQVTQFINTPGHALLLVGTPGIGKTYLAERIVAETLAIEQNKVQNHPYITIVRQEENKDTISIEAIRDLQRFLRLKTTGHQQLRRAVIVEYADTLTIEAQNAFLKLLEEPPQDTILVLTANNPRSLLPTILSRVQTIVLHTPEESVVKEYFLQQGKNSDHITQAYFLSGGAPGLMTALLDDSIEHSLRRGVTIAKEILQKSLFERLAMVDTLSKQKDEAKAMLHAMLFIAQTGLDTAANKANLAKIKQWHQILKTSSQTLAALNQNSNPKLTLTNMMFSL